MKLRAFPSASVLIVVLWVCLALVSITLIFGHSAMLAYQAEANDIAGRQADQAIEGGLRYAEFILANSDTPGAFPAYTDYVSEAVPVGQGTFWIIGRGEDEDYGVTREFGFTDEAGRININTASEPMLENLGFTPDQGQAIQDWRTASTTAAPTPTNSTAKGGPFESVEELALIDGMDLTLLNGEDQNFNGILDPNEDDGDKSDPPDNADGKLDAGALEYVTAFSIEPENDPDGLARVDITNIATALGTLTTNYPNIKFPAPPRSAQPCGGPLDFLVQTNMDPTEFDSAYSYMRTPELKGKINVNTATLTVLNTIPGLQNKAADLVSARQARTQPDNSLSWVRPVLGDALCTAVAPYLTGRTYQVSVDIAAVGQNGRGYRRTRFVIDLRGASPKVMYRKDFTALGWALGPEARQQWTAPLTTR